jgi:K+-transporting ATPase A subunit
MLVSTGRTNSAYSGYLCGLIIQKKICPESYPGDRGVISANAATAGLRALSPGNGATVGGAWYNTALGLVMLLGRFVPMVFVLGLAGSFAQQKPVPESAGTLRAYQPLFVVMLVGVTLILVGLTYLPALALGPLADSSH